MSQPFLFTRLLCRTLRVVFRIKSVEYVPLQYRFYRIPDFQQELVNMLLKYCRIGRSCLGLTGLHKDWAEKSCPVKLELQWE